MLRKNAPLFDPAPANPANQPSGGQPLPPTVSEVQNATRDQERNRIRALNAAAEAVTKDRPDTMEQVRTLTREAIEKGTTSHEFNAELLRTVLQVKPAPVINSDSIGMSAREKKEYSFLRGIRSCVELSRTVPDGLEGEVHRAMDARLRTTVGTAAGGGPGGFWVPFDQGMPARRNRRDLTVGVFGQGGATVPTNIMTPVIELLRNRMVCDRLGVQTLSGLEGNVAIPRQTGAATAYTVSETAALTVSNQALDQIPLTPRRVGAVGRYSKQLLLQSAIDVENFIRDDLMKVLAIKHDYLILQGAGANSEPLGIMNTPGIGSVIFGGSASWTSIIAFETALAIANADVGDMAYVTTPSVRGKLKSAAKIGTTFPIFIWEDGDWNDGSNDGKINGYRAAVTNQILNNAVMFGNFNDCINALWGGYDVVVNPYSFDVNAEVQITVNTFMDVAVRHAASFVWSADAGNQ